MTTVNKAAEDFLALERIAVAGVSRTKSNAANLIYRTLRSNGQRVFAVNPNAATVEGDTSYADLRSLPEKPEGVVIVTKPGTADEIVRECAELGIVNVWMHNGMGGNKYFQRRSRLLPRTRHQRNSGRLPDDVCQKCRFWS